MTARPTPPGATNDEPHRGHHATTHGSGPRESSPGLLPQLVQQTASTNGALASTALRMVAQVNSPAYLTTLGRSLLAAGNHALARQNLLRAVQLDPQAADAWQGLGEACRHLGLDDEAIDAWTTALQLRPDTPEIHERLGALYRRRGNFEQAMTHLYQVAQLRVDAPAPHNSRQADTPSPWLPLAELYWDQGNASEALEYFDRAFTGRACDARAEYLRGLIALAREQWQEGWRRFEYRRVLRPHLPQGGWPQPIWDGDCQHLANQQIIVHSEGKLADDVLFAAWLPELIRRSGGTIIKCAPPLVQLFARSFPQAMVTAAGSSSLHLPHAHWQTALGSLPRHLGVDAVADCSAPAATPLAPWSVPTLSAKADAVTCTRIDGSHSNDYRGYLVADWKLRRQWQRRVEHLGPGRKIGLAGWQSLGHDADEPLRSLWDAPQAQWLLLGRTADNDAIANLPGHVHRIRALPRRKDLDDWAALLSSLDLVITPPGLIAHLAGALGVPVWVLTPAMAPWCWGVQGERSRWYPLARLFRQEAVDQWHDVLARMAGELAG